VVTWSEDGHWRDHGDTSGRGVKAKVFDAGGGQVGSEFLVNCTTLNNQDWPSVARLTSGGFVVSWHDYGGEGGDDSLTGIKAQIFDASGAKVGSEFLINTTTPSYQLNPTIVGLASGGFVVSWMDSSGHFNQGSDSSGYGLRAKRRRSAPQFLAEHGAFLPARQQHHQRN
jgi:hypothetical protein